MFGQSVLNLLPWIKAMDPVQSIELATLAMLPRWEGFCTDKLEGVKMTAWEAVERVLHVEYCMCNSESMEGYNYTTLRLDVPKGYDLGKVKMFVKTFHKTLNNFLLERCLRREFQLFCIVLKL